MPPPCGSKRGPRQGLCSKTRKRDENGAHIFSRTSGPAACYRGCGGRRVEEGGVRREEGGGRRKEGGGWREVAKQLAS